MSSFFIFLSILFLVRSSPIEEGAQDYLSCWLALCITLQAVAVIVVGLNFLKTK